ncbi:hypothetical protein MBLNU459_g6400t1 [Dothideomycetes sp. NU459]
MELRAETDEEDDFLYTRSRPDARRRPLSAKACQGFFQKAHHVMNWLCIRAASCTRSSSSSPPPPPPPPPPSTRPAALADFVGWSNACSVTAESGQCLDTISNESGQCPLQLPPLPLRVRSNMLCGTSQITVETIMSNAMRKKHHSVMQPQRLQRLAAGLIA